MTYYGGSLQLHRCQYEVYSRTVAVLDAGSCD
jgi:hypothetical protein